MQPSDQPAKIDATSLRIGLVVSEYHRAITSAMQRAASTAFVDAGGRAADLLIIPAPGAYELVAITNGLAQRGDVDAVVALGCIVSGETTHDQYIAHAVAHGLAAVTVATSVPVAFGVLTCQSLEQAEARAGGARGNKGEEAMQAAIRSAMILRDIGDRTIGGADVRAS